MTNMKTVWRGILAACLVLSPVAAEAGTLGGAAARGAARSIAKALPRRPLGPLYRFRKPTPLERFSNKPKTDLRRGLPPHSFWRTPQRGPKTAEGVREKLNIPHEVKRAEKTIAAPGTPYHERPIQGGERGAREKVLHERVAPRDLQLGDALQHPGSGR